MAAVSYPLCTNNPACDQQQQQGHQVLVGQEGQPTRTPPVPRCVAAGKCVESCSAYGRVCPCAARAAGRAACEAVKKLKENSTVFTTNGPTIDATLDDAICCVGLRQQQEEEGGEKHQQQLRFEMTQLNADDLVIGEKLGEGGFSLVNACTLKSDPTRKLAIKYLKRKVMVNQRSFEHGAADLAQEAHFLHVLDHPHIVKLHGVTAGSVHTNVASGKECGFFITMDRLEETLEQRLERWRQEEQNNQVGVLARMSSEYKEKKREEIKKRVRIALQIAEGIEYLHNKNIIFRDLKPDNIAFDDEGILKLFDFGLAKELKPCEGKPDGRWELTGNTGSRRYMAVEVAKELPYNKSVDAYSFGIMLHELVSGEKPFYGYSSGKHMSLVVMGGERPKMDNKYTQYWPMNLQWLMKRCWSPFPTSRPDFAIIKQTLQDVLDDKDTIPDLRSSAPAPFIGSTTTTSTNNNTANTTKICGLEPPASGFASLLRPKRTKAKSNGTTSSTGSNDSTSSPSNSNRRSWGWVFRK